MSTTGTTNKVSLLAGALAVAAVLAGAGPSQALGLQGFGGDAETKGAYRTQNSVAPQVTNRTARPAQGFGGDAETKGAYRTQNSVAPQVTNRTARPGTPGSPIPGLQGFGGDAETKGAYRAGNSG